MKQTNFELKYLEKMNQLGDWSIKADNKAQVEGFQYLASREYEDYKKKYGEIKPEKHG